MLASPSERFSVRNNQVALCQNLLRFSNIKSRETSVNKKVIGGGVLAAVVVAALYAVYLGFGTNQAVKINGSIEVQREQAKCRADLVSHVETCVTFFNETLPPYFVNLSGGSPWPVPGLARDQFTDLHRQTKQNVDAWNNSPSAKTKFVLKDIPSITNNYAPQ